MIRRIARAALVITAIIVIDLAITADRPGSPDTSTHINR